MRLELKHAVTLFFATVFLDFLIFLFTGGQSTYSVGEVRTVGLLVIPAAAYLFLCYWIALGTLHWADRGPAPRRVVYVNWLPWMMAGLVVLMVVGVSGPTFFSIEAINRQHVFNSNPWIPVVVLTALPIALMAIISAHSWKRIAIFSLMVTFFSFSGSRIHVMALILALVMAHSNRKVKLRHLIIGGFVAIFLLDFLASLRESEFYRASGEAKLIQLFSSGHYSTFDIQTMLMDPSEYFNLEPIYILVAAIGPLRQVFGLQIILSSSEYFTAIADPGRFYNDRSLATVGLTGEVYMIIGWFGASLVGMFVGLVALLKRLLFRLSRYNHQMEILLRAIGFLHLYLLLRADMWIFFVYLWLQLPVLFALAIFFSKLRSQR